MTCELLLEIGTEEIPAGYIGPALKAFRRLAEAALIENRIRITGSLETYGTPRRLILVGKSVSEQQDDLIQEITGPPKNVAYDEKGRPTKAALGFAQKQGVPVEALSTVETPKGEYLHVKRRIPGRNTGDILAEILPDLISGIPWPKSMRWGSIGFSFARPVHWVVALFGGANIPFEVAGVKSGRRTRGHRFMGAQDLEVIDFDDYCKKMAGNYVIIDQREREHMVARIVREAAESVGGSPVDDQELVSTVANLVEYPSAVCGGFDERFLDLPEAVLITPMKEHQKYFAVYEGRKLMPHFVAVNNTLAKDDAVVRRGHERVLRARLSDADFFFEEDRKRPLADLIGDLKNVIYQADLGTSYAKVKRFTTLADYLCDILQPDKKAHVKAAAELCKCDLITEMVGEFPSLQGIMGEIYARMDGHPEEVCRGIYEHYLPTKAGGPLPETAVGAIVGCADRMDTIVGIFAIGLEPTGSADPFALRRHALAILRIAEDRAWNLSLKAFVEKALSILGEEMQFDRDTTCIKVIEFFKERYRQLMLRSGYQTDLVEAVISAGFDRIVQLRSRMDHLRRFSSESEGFSELALTVKRVTNILKNQEKSFQVDPSLFKERCEVTLWEAYESLKEKVEACMDKGAYGQALEILAQLREPVDAFFEGVEVLTKESRSLRDNRVGVLEQLSKLFLRVADFSKFSI